MTISTSAQGVIQREITLLSQSISGLVQSLHRLKSPIVESSEKVPQATDQLDKISQQTEAATTRMLDMLEQITQREQQIITGLQHIGTEVADQPAAKKVDELSDLANTNLNDAYTIMDALQFQDITSQQMDHAAAMLEEIESKLKAIMCVIGEDAEKIAFKPEVSGKKKRSYDPHADLFNKITDQADIDSIFAKTKRK